MNKPRLPTQGVNCVLPEGTVMKQDLKTLRRGYLGMKDIIGLSADSPGAFMLRAFDTIFKKNGHVSEGRLTDIIWGLRQSADFNDDMIGAALTELKTKGFIYYSDPDGLKMSDVALIESKKPIWVRYTDKFMGTFAAI